MVASDGEVQVFTGVGSGGFAAGFTDVTGTETGGEGGTGYIRDVAALGDFNGDGKTDLVVGLEKGDLSSAQIVMLDGNGSGGFTPAATFAAGNNIQNIQVADLNHDGHPDLIVTEYFSQGTSSAVGIVVYGGLGNGMFSTPVTYGLTDLPETAALADLNGDGQLDLVVGLQSGGFDVLLGNGSGGFGAATKIDTSEGATTPIAVADLNDDGNPDVIVGSEDGFSVLLGNGSGGFGAPTTYAVAPATYVSGISVADVNGDGKPDLIYDDSDGTVVMPGVGDGTFGDAQTYTIASSGFTSFISTVADFNRDGVPDVAVGADDGGFAILQGANLVSASQITTAAPAQYLRTGQTATFTITAAQPPGRYTRQRRRHAEPDAEQWRHGIVHGHDAPRRPYVHADRGGGHGHVGPCGHGLQ